MTSEKKNVIWNIFGSTANAFSSLIFSIIVTRINGEFDAGIFIYCFATACLFYCIANYSGRTFQVTDISKKFSDSDYIYNRIFTCVIMLLVTIGFTVIKGYDIYKSAILIVLCVYKAIEAFSESLYAIIQRNNGLYKVGISMFLKAIFSMILLFVIDFITKDLILSSAIILIINLFFIAFYDIRNIKKINLNKTKFSKELNIKLFKSGFFTFILTILGMYLINASRYAIDDILTNDFQTIFGIIIMPATFMALLGQYIIQPSLTKISYNIENKKYDDLKAIIKRLIMIILGLGAIVTGVAWVLELPVLELIYGLDLHAYFTCMMIIVVGSVFYSLITILSAVLIAMRKTLGQTVIYGLISVFATIMAYILVKQNGVYGASITYFISMIIVAMIFLTYTIINMKKYKKIWSKKGEMSYEK